jgi:hypothetical protein
MVSMLQVREIEQRLRSQQQSLPYLNIDGARRLLGLPAIHEDEVFSSWIVRMMLSRKINKRKLLEEINWREAIHLADLEPDSFNLKQLVLRFNLIQIGLLERSFLQFQMPFTDSLCLTTEIFNRQPIFRFCPYCIAEEPYIKKSWRYAFSYACPDHGCLLLERCTQCGEAIDFEKLNIAKMDDLNIHDLRSCLYCGAALSSQQPHTISDRAMNIVLGKQASMFRELSNGIRINDYIAQIRYSDKGLMNYLNVGVSGSLIFKEDADEIRTAFRKGGIFPTTYWHPSGCISITKGIGKVKRAQRWVIKHRQQHCSALTSQFVSTQTTVITADVLLQ